MHGQSYSKDFSWAPRYRQVFINDFLTGFSKRLFNNNLEIKAGSFASTVRHAPYIIIRSSMMLKEALATPRYGHSTTIKNYKRRCTYCVIFLSYAALDAGKSRISNSITVNYFCLRFAQLFSFYYLCKSNPKGLSGILLFLSYYSFYLAKPSRQLNCWEFCITLIYIGVLLSGGGVVVVISHHFSLVISVIFFELCNKR